MRWTARWIWAILSDRDELGFDARATQLSGGQLFRQTQRSRLFPFSSSRPWLQHVSGDQRVLFPPSFPSVTRFELSVPAFCLCCFCLCCVFLVGCCWRAKAEFDVFVCLCSCAPLKTPAEVNPRTSWTTRWIWVKPFRSSPLQPHFQI